MLVILLLGFVYDCQKKEAEAADSFFLIPIDAAAKVQ